MDAGACQSCGAELAAGASFCATCGVAIGSTPVLDLLPTSRTAAPDEGHETADARGRRAARTIVVVVIVVVLALIALSTVTGGDDADPEQSSDTSLPARRTTTSARTSRTTSTALPVFEPGQTLSPAFGTALVHGLGDDVMTVVDLATGAESEVPLPDGVHGLAWTGEILVATTAYAVYHPALDASGEWVQIPLPDWDSWWMESSAIIRLERQDEDVVEVGLATVDGEGALHMWPSRSVTPAGPQSTVGVMGESLVLSTFDGVYTIDRSGDARRVASGRALATAGGRLLRHACDDRMRCGLSVLDVRTGEERVLPPLPEEREIMTGTLSPDGDAVAVGGYAEAGEWSAALSGGKWVDIQGMSLWGLSVVWDRAGMVWWDWQARTVRSLALPGTTGGELAVSGDQRLIRAGSDPTAPIAIVPLEALPEAWRP